MGQVYQAKDPLLGGVIVAVKFLSRSKMTQRVRDRFMREATISALLGEQSIHIVKVRDYGIVARICRQSIWPTDKPRAEIVFPQPIEYEDTELATIWSMLSGADIEKYQHNKPHSQFLFVGSPHPMLLTSLQRQISKKK